MQPALPLSIADERHADRPRRAFLALLILCLAMAFLGRGAFLSQPYADDPSVFILMGRIVTDGGVMYRDFFDTKPPGVPLLMSVLWKFFGPSWPAYVLFQVALGTAGALLLGEAAGRFVLPRLRRPVTLFTAVYFNAVPFVYSGFQLESIQSFCSILAAAAALAALAMDHSKPTPFRRLAPLAVGLFAGCAATIKPSGLSVALAYFIALLFRPNVHQSAPSHSYPPNESQPPRIRSILLMLAGLSLPAVIVIHWTIAGGTFDQLPEVFHQIALYTSQTPASASFWNKLIVIPLVLFLPHFLRWLFQRRQHRPQIPAPRAITVFAIVWFIAEAAGIVLQRRMYGYHFLVAVPPLALLFGLIPKPDRLIPTLASLVFPAALSAMLALLKWTSFFSHGIDRLPVSDYLAANANASQSVWADPMPRIVNETGLRPGGSIASSFYFCNHDDAPQLFSRRLIHDFQTRRTDFVILPQNLDRIISDNATYLPMLAERPLRREHYLAAWRDLRQYIAIHYTPQAEIDHEIIYRRIYSLDDSPHNAAREVRTSHPAPVAIVGVQ